MSVTMDTMNREFHRVYQRNVMAAMWQLTGEQLEAWIKQVMGFSYPKHSSPLTILRNLLALAYPRIHDLTYQNPRALDPFSMLHKLPGDIHYGWIQNMASIQDETALYLSQIDLRSQALRFYFYTDGHRECGWIVTAPNPKL